jgi:hypothetical protein
MREHGGMSWPGCEIRELPDGSRSFEVVEPGLNWIRIDYQTRLQFGVAELAIESPFSLRVGDTVLNLDPNDRRGLGPLLALYPDSLTHLTMAPDGTLEAAFASGAVLTVLPDPRFEAWSIGGFWCPPGGFPGR